MKLKSELLTLFVFALTITSSCKKGLDNSCYDPIYHKSHKDDVCTNDCPGVTGSDEKFYCNECEMHRAGIKKAL